MLNPTDLIGQSLLNAYTQEDRRRNIDAGKNIFHLAAEALQKLGFADAGKILPTRGQKIFNSAAE